MKLPPKPRLELSFGSFPSGITDSTQWGAWGRACAEAMREACIQELQRQDLDNPIWYLRNIKIEE